MASDPASAPTLACWCGGALGDEIGLHYRRCVECGSAVLVMSPAPAHYDVADDEHDFYGRTYWTDYAKRRNFPDIFERACSDLSERCVFWLERLLEVVHPPGRVLEIGCGHGGFVRFLQELGFEATGTELSPWVVDFAKRTFDVSVRLGRLETLALEPGFRCIAAFDVLEHVSDPLDMVRRCRELLAPDGVLLFQTPWYRGEGPDWSMFQADEHVHLFSEPSVRRLLQRAGFDEIVVRPSLFPHDMWVVARPAGAAASRVSPADSPWAPVAFTTLLKMRRQMNELRKTLAEVEADRGDRLAQVHELTRSLETSQDDRAARLEQIHELTRLLQQSEVDRAARLDVIVALQAQLEAIHRTWTWRLYCTLRPRSRRSGAGE